MAPSDRPPRSGLLLLPVILGSGFAGLGYEMVWTRLLSVAVGSDMMAILGSIAGFFAGLALGAFVLDGPLRRAASPRLAYAALESVIGLWGLLSIWLLPVAGRTLASLLGTQPPAWQLWATSFALPVMVLLPATVSMGGTLTALERLLAQSRGGEHRSAGVYAANTAGALAGTLCSVFLLFPALGLAGTLALLAGVNFLCAAGALLWHPPDTKALGTTPSATQVPDTTAPDARAPGLVWRTDFALLLSGLLGIVIEVLVVRLAAQILQNTIFSFAALLSVYLLGTALGSALWQRTRWQLSAGGLAPLLALVSLSGLASAFAAPRLAGLVAQSAGLGLAADFAVALALLLLPATAMGALFGCLLQQVRAQRGSIGRAIGINSIGAALAPWLASQCLIPAAGAWRALVMAAAAYLLLMPLRRRSLRWFLLPALLSGALLLGPAASLVHIPEGGGLLALREGPMVTASAVDDPSGARYLEVNGQFRMGGTSSQRSDFRQAMLPLLLHPDPHRALFLGVGTGATLRGGARLPGVQVQGVELSAEVVDLLPWFAGPGQDAVLPPVLVADARRFVAADRGQYDVIVADLYHPALEGSGTLYTTEHFSAVRQRLAPGGLFCQWLPLYQLDAPSLRAIIRSFLRVYPQGSAWLNHFSVKTPMLALVGYAGAGHLDLDALAARLADPAVVAGTHPVGLMQSLDVLGQFVGGPRALAAFAADTPANTDDRPFVALDAQRNVRALTVPPAELLLTVVHQIHPDLAELAGTVAPAPLEPRLAAYWRARDRFLEAGAALRGEPRGAALVEAAAPGLLAAIRLSPDFDPAYQPLLGMARALLSVDPDAGQRLLASMVEAAPSRSEAAVLLAAQRAPTQGVN